MSSYLTNAKTYTLIFVFDDSVNWGQAVMISFNMFYNDLKITLPFEMQQLCFHNRA